MPVTTDMPLIDYIDTHIRAQFGLRRSTNVLHDFDGPEFTEVEFEPLVLASGDPIPWYWDSINGRPTEDAVGGGDLGRMLRREGVDCDALAAVHANQRRAQAMLGFALDDDAALFVHLSADTNVGDSSIILSSTLHQRTNGVWWACAYASADYCCHVDRMVQRFTEREVHRHTVDDFIDGVHGREPVGDDWQERFRQALVDSPGTVTPATLTRIAVQTLDDEIEGDSWMMLPALEVPHNDR